MEAIHITDNYLVNPTNPLTINLIGAGGTGSNMLMALAKMNHALLALGHPGFHVMLYDDDKVSEANLGRQLFAGSELGLFKSSVLINRVNRFFGTNWKAVNLKFCAEHSSDFPDDGRANFFITCVDNIETRFWVSSFLTKLESRSRYERNRPLYWMDLGNSRQTGQVVLSTIHPVEQPESEKYSTVPRLPHITDEFGSLLEQSDKTDNAPSCSVAEALQKQDLFINPSLANLGASLIWQMIREGMLFNRGFFLNLSDFRLQPLKVA